VPRPKIHWITFTIDGREVDAPENAMLVDAAKYGDIEIPVFCYEPKLGMAVGACRMCLVEVEGIPKLQTACSTPVKDGMVVHTQTERVREAQNAVLEFLLINHPLDCPVCDKGGECPLQDITYGWGPGTSRFIEPKRHFKKPLELSPLIAIDRERCILCYRCVRFSQEVAEDYQLVLLERGAHAFVGTFDGHPYLAPFSGNITELCPVGALTSSSYRFRARPWDIEGAGTICALCPGQCNVELTVRDERVLRVLARDNAEVEDGWLCDRGRYSFQHVHSDERIVQPLVREGEALLPASWEKALDTAARALAKAKAKAAAVAGRLVTNEEAFLLARLMRDHLGAAQLTANPAGEPPAAELAALGAPALAATVPDLQFAHAVLLLDCDPLDEAPVWDLRIRKGVRRHGVRLAVASARPTALDPNAVSVTRFAPGGAEALLVALDAALAGDAGNLGGAAAAAGSNARTMRELAETLRDAGSDLVIVYPERLVSGPRGAEAARALLNVAARLELGEHAGAGLLGIPFSANGRGAREAGLAGGDAPAIAAGLAGGEISTLLLFGGADVLRTYPDRAAWERALGAAQVVIAHEAFLTDTVERFADVVFPAETYPEKEGTLTHPDGRLQRLRPAIGRPGGGVGARAPGVRPGWQVLAELSKRCGFDQRVLAGPMASQQLFAAVPFYAGLTLDEIGGRGVRWPAREQAAAASNGAWEPVALDVPPSGAAVGDDGTLRLGTFQALWAGPEVEHAPVLQFARMEQVVELSPLDAARLGVADGEQVEVGAPDGPRIAGSVKVRQAVPAGSAFVAAGTSAEPANALTGATVVVTPLGSPANGGARADDGGVAAATSTTTVPGAPEGAGEPSQESGLESPPGTGFGQTEDGST
jgi:NADH-quinone oxidoreductase subunit G